MILSPDIVRHLNHYGIVVADAVESQREAAVGCLEALGLNRIYEAGHGADALQIVHGLDRCPAVVMFDIEMPVMDGIELTRQLATDGLYPSLLIASALDPAVLEAMQGMVEALGLVLLGALRKPLSPELVSPALARFQPAARAIPVAW